MPEPKPPSSHPEFVSEPVTPEPGTFDAAAMGRGEPGLPSRFTWRNTRHEVAHALRTWKTSTPERGELYLRRHWHEVVTTAGHRLVLYCERQTKNRNKPTQRWWVYSVRWAAKEGDGDD
jgi:phosphoribosylglycinamide formyltransferase-1